LSAQFQPPADGPKVEPPQDDAPFPIPTNQLILMDFERISLALPKNIKETRDLVNEIQRRKNYFMDLADPEAKAERDAKKAAKEKLKEEKRKKEEEKKKKEEEIKKKERRSEIG